MDPESELAAARLRLATPGDAESIARLWVGVEVEPPSPRELGLRIASVLVCYPWLVLELDGDIVAHAYATRLRDRPAYDWIAETSVSVDRSMHRRGLGERVYAALLDLLAIQGMIWAYASIEGDGPRQRFHERMGFERVGRFPAVAYKDGRWWDVEWWRFALAEPGEPEPIRALCDPRLREAVAERLAWT